MKVTISQASVARRRLLHFGTFWSHKSHGGNDFYILDIGISPQVLSFHQIKYSLSSWFVARTAASTDTAGNPKQHLKT
jgi:hypothetical protein